MNVERMLEIEQRFSVSLRSLSVMQEDGFLTVNGEINALTKGPIPHDVEIVAAAYGTKDEVLSTASTSFVAEDFMGFDTFSILLETRDSRVTRVRVYPRKG